MSDEKNVNVNGNNRVLIRKWYEEPNEVVVIYSADAVRSIAAMSMVFASIVTLTTVAVIAHTKKYCKKR